MITSLSIAANRHDPAFDRNAAGLPLNHKRL